MYTRKEFEELRVQWARGMAQDQALADDARSLLVRADRHNWIHQGTWMGEPVLQLPWDLMATQEIIYNTRPRVIIEVGVAWGGSLLFYSTLMEALGGDLIIGIDVYTPDDLKQRLASHGRLSERIRWVTGSSIDPDTVRQVRELVGGRREVMVCLDSFHTHEHVLSELRQYSPLVGKGGYLICGDTVVDYLPVQEHRPRPWGPGNNPRTAVDQFLSENPRFEVDTLLENKLLFSCHPGGYLRAKED